MFAVVLLYDVILGVSLATLPLAVGMTDERCAAHIGSDPGLIPGHTKRWGTAGKWTLDVASKAPRSPGR